MGKPNAPRNVLANVPGSSRSSSKRRQLLSLRTTTLRVLQSSSSSDAASPDESSDTSYGRVNVGAAVAADGGFGELEVSWGAPDWSGGFPLVHYTLTLQRWAGSGDTFTPVIFEPSGSARVDVAVSPFDAAARPDTVPEQIFHVRGLPGGEYRFGLQAVNSAGDLGIVAWTPRVAIVGDWCGDVGTIGCTPLMLSVGCSFFALLVLGACCVVNRRRRKAWRPGTTKVSGKPYASLAVGTISSTNDAIAGGLRRMPSVVYGTTSRYRSSSLEHSSVSIDEAGAVQSCRSGWMDLRSRFAALLLPTVSATAGSRKLEVQTLCVQIDELRDMLAHERSLREAAEVDREELRVELETVSSEMGSSSTRTGAHTDGTPDSLNAFQIEHQAECPGVCTYSYMQRDVGSNTTERMASTVHPPNSSWPPRARIMPCVSNKGPVLSPYTSTTTSLKPRAVDGTGLEEGSSSSCTIDPYDACTASPDLPLRYLRNSPMASSQRGFMEAPIDNQHQSSHDLSQPPLSRALASPSSADGSMYGSSSSKEHVRRRVHDLIVERVAARRLNLDELTSKQQDADASQPEHSMLTDSWNCDQVASATARQAHGATPQGEGDGPSSVAMGEATNGFEVAATNILAVRKTPSIGRVEPGVLHHSGIGARHRCDFGTMSGAEAFNSFPADSRSSSSRSAASDASSLSAPGTPGRRGRSAEPKLCCDQRQQSVDCIGVLRSSVRIGSSCVQRASSADPKNRSVQRASSADPKNRRIFADRRSRQTPGGETMTTNLNELMREKAAIRRRMARWDAHFEATHDRPATDADRAESKVFAGLQQALRRATQQLLQASMSCGQPEEVVKSSPGRATPGRAPPGRASGHGRHTCIQSRPRPCHKPPVRQGIGRSQNATVGAHRDETGTRTRARGDNKRSPARSKHNR